ncbi:MAG: Ig-like domain-containing protein [candidate division KSB1 bacterium]|nr:Ig-like domain-containing protein [candidate division KSB1 bacterium]MDZ7285949.1 Ig-like domain-containing protein [candidate division KSB1 bacterium]MDZ7298981.1 Ig-like domain-containing protein [candidate division KSB1 bacterium]MDZ7309357.1 Ig-like domain-containing protein [candidate division KSB1 bacterium]MDZ7349874.1 Ig-like domain-containing protein [candidate division KSB1 bacterium]
MNTPPRRFSDGDPDIAPLDVLFLEELSLLTGDAKYADFLQANSWNKLAAGTCGERNDQNCAEWAETIPVFEDFSHWTAMEPVYRSMPAIAVHYTGESAHRADLLASIIKKLEETGANDRDGDLTGIAGALQASAHTGVNLDPQTGRWADFNTTQDFVDFLVSYQRRGGDWPYDTGMGAALFVGDVSTTSWAMMALKAWDAERYADNIRRGIEFIKAQQQANGQILTNPGAPPNTTAGVEVPGEALVAIGTDDCTLYDASPAPANQAPLAEDDLAETVEAAAVTIAVPVNDTDPDGSLDPGSVTIVRSPGNGQAQVNDNTGAITYTPAAGSLVKTASTILCGMTAAPTPIPPLSSLP